MHQSGDPQRNHVRRIGNQENGDSHIEYHQRSQDTLGRELDSHDNADVDGQSGLNKAQQRLVHHVRHDVGRYVHSRAVLPLDYLPLAADDLDGVEASVPDCNAAQGQCTLERSFHGHEEIVPDHQRDKTGDYDGHRKKLPVVLVDEHPEQPDKADAHLLDPSPVSRSPYGILNFLSHCTPPHTS